MIYFSPNINDIDKGKNLILTRAIRKPSVIFLTLFSTQKRYICIFEGEQTWIL